MKKRTATRGSQRPVGLVDHQQLPQVEWRHTLERLKNQKGDLEGYPLWNSQPMKVLKNGSDRFVLRCEADDPGSRIEKTLKLLEIGLAGASQEGVAHVGARDYESMHQLFHLLVPYGDFVISVKRILTF
jgi:hypothetical protein